MAEMMKEVVVVEPHKYEVREVERCLDENKKQSDINPLWQTRAVLEIMDNCRKQWNLKFDGE